jgi:uncharacterized protein (DUF302 family)
MIGYGGQLFAITRDERGVAMKPITAALLAWLIWPAVTLGQTESVVEVTASGSWDDVKQQLVLAIENHGLVVNHESKVGEMLERTGKDLGALKQIYTRAEVLEFCSAALSRQVMEADPRMLALCPYGIGIYTLAGEGGKVHLVYRRPRLDGAAAAAPALQRVDQLLHDIVQEAGQ